MGHATYALALGSAGFSCRLRAGRRCIALRLQVERICGGMGGQ
jgi:hypothetical protein